MIFSTSILFYPSINTRLSLKCIHILDFSFTHTTFADHLLIDKFCETGKVAFSTTCLRVRMEE